MFANQQTLSLIVITFIGIIHSSNNIVEKMKESRNLENFVEKSSMNAKRSMLTFQRTRDNDLVSTMKHWHLKSLKYWERRIQSWTSLLLSSVWKVSYSRGSTSHNSIQFPIYVYYRNHNDKKSPVVFVYPRFVLVSIAIPPRRVSQSLLTAQLKFRRQCRGYVKDREAQRIRFGI